MNNLIVKVIAPFVAIAVVVAACDSSEESTAQRPTAQAVDDTPKLQEASEAVGSVGEPVVDETPTAEDDAEPSMTEAQIEAFVHRWLATQNDGDFEAYGSLYAERFFGIRRSGDRERSFDRDGWMQDRERMFDSPMTVEMADLEISISGDAAVVLFEQTWESGTYRDVGPKQLVLMVEDDRLRISREEMIQSTIEESTVEAVRRQMGRLAFVIRDEPYVVLDIGFELERDDDELSRFGPDGRAVVSAVADDELPQKFRQWRGERFDLYSPSGVACSGEITGFEIVSRAIPHFSMTSPTYDGDGGGDSPQDYTSLVWEMGTTKLLGRVSAEDCTGALWARHGDFETPEIYSQVVLEEPAARELDELVDELHWPEQEIRDPGRPLGDDEPRVSAYESDTGELFAVVSKAIEKMCAVDTYSVVFERGDDGWVQRGDGSRFDVETVVDVDGDGTPVLIGVDGEEDVIRTPADDRIVSTDRLPWPSYDCPC